MKTPPLTSSTGDFEAPRLDLREEGASGPSRISRFLTAAKTPTVNTLKVLGVAGASLGILYLVQKFGFDMTDGDIFSGTNVALVSIAAALTAMAGYQLRATVRAYTENDNPWSHKKRLAIVGICLAVGVLAIYIANMYIYKGDINPENHLMQDDIYARLGALGAASALIGYHLHRSDYARRFGQATVDALLYLPRRARIAYNKAKADYEARKTLLTEGDDFETGRGMLAHGAEGGQGLHRTTTARQPKRNTRSDTHGVSSDPDA